MNILLTFTGFHDPYAIGLLGEEEQLGPILSLVREQAFDRIILFSTPNTEKNTAATREAIQSIAPHSVVEVKHLALADPTEYLNILDGLRAHFREISENTPGASYFISVTSGTPQMHACWLLLAASGEIPARILNIRPLRFVSKDRPHIAEVDFTLPEFPLVRANVEAIDLPDTPPPDLEKVIKQLGIVGDHPATRKALETGAMLASSKAPILILGETGTGKELFAKFIHHLSGRPRDSFVPLNCAAIPRELVESLLFGHKRGCPSPKPHPPLVSIT